MPFDVIEYIDSNSTNFSFGPEVGKYYYFDADANGDFANPALKEKIAGSSAGSSQTSATYPALPLSPPLANNIISLSYDGSFFWTLENASSISAVVLRRWKIEGSFLVEKQTYTYLSSVEGIRMQVGAAAVEHYHRVMGGSVISGDTTVNIGSNAGIIANQTYVTLGPSTHSDNLGQTEYKKVSSLTLDTSIVFGSGVTYKYNVGDPVSFYTNVWLFNYHRTSSADNEGKIIIKNLYTGSTITTLNRGFCSKVTASKFYDGKVFLIVPNNMLAINTSTYLNEQSMLLGCEEDNYAEYSTVYDIEIDAEYIYKLQDKYTTRLPSGELKTYDNWDGSYNIQKVVKENYPYSIGFSFAKQVLPGDGSTTSNVIARLRDQYFVPLSNEFIEFSLDNAGGGSILPTSIETPVSGNVSTTYTAGSSAVNGVVEAEVTGINLLSKVKFRQLAEFSSYNLVRQRALFFSYGLVRQRFSFSSFGLVRQRTEFESFGLVRQADSLSGEGLIRQRATLASFVGVRQVAQKNSFSLIRQLPSKMDDFDINQFLFSYEQYPLPGAIKIPITANIWIKLLPYSTPLVLNTLYFEVEGVDVTDQVYVELVETIPGQGQLLYLLYDPSVNFNYSQHVDVLIIIEDTPTYNEELGVYTNNTFTSNFYFDCVPDTRRPYIANISPGNNDIGVETLPTIYFDLYDVGEGVDISTLILTVDGCIVTPSISVIANGYHVSYTPTEAFAFNQKVIVSVEITDISAQRNSLLYIWDFVTEESQPPMFTNFDPSKCEFNLTTLKNVSLDVYGLEDGLDSTTIKLRVDDQLVDFILIPKVYRIL